MSEILTGSYPVHKKNLVEMFWLSRKQNKEQKKNLFPIMVEKHRRVPFLKILTVITLEQEPVMMTD